MLLGSETLAIAPATVRKIVTRMTARECRVARRAGFISRP